MLTSPPINRTRPVFKIAATDDQEKFQPLPAPSGPYPYHLDIKKVIPGITDQKMVFHMAGDTGGFQLPFIKHLVVTEMIKQCNEAILPEDHPAFFFHLGDVVYNFGQAEQYYPQFFGPYKNYPGPVFAIAGNHDGDIDPSDPSKPKSLDAFMQVFCSTVPAPVKFAGNINRKSNIQPNVYWTLKTPLANFICLYGNVPRFGAITSEQKKWFIEELKTAVGEKDEKALILCVHNSAYSSDTNHGSSLPMQLFLNAAFEEAGVYPDIVFSGHVHNYQRLNKKYPDGKILPFVVAGAGGYADLHKIALLNDPDHPDTSSFLDNVCLEKYCDNAHGFLKITIEKTKDHFFLKGDYHTISFIDNDNSTSSLYDSFTINLRR